MDKILFDTIQVFIISELNEGLKPVLQQTNENLIHNHPPLRFKVDDCEHCQKIGNIFCIS